MTETRRFGPPRPPTDPPAEPIRIPFIDEDSMLDIDPPWNQPPPLDPPPDLPPAYA